MTKAQTFRTTFWDLTMRDPAWILPASPPEVRAQCDTSVSCSTIFDVMQLCIRFAMVQTPQVSLHFHRIWLRVWIMLGSSCSNKSRVSFAFVFMINRCIYSTAGQLLYAWNPRLLDIENEVGIVPVNTFKVIWYYGICLKKIVKLFIINDLQISEFRIT
jgi:hypothetical protein